jgi:hypothetical protein
MDIPVERVQAGMTLVVDRGEGPQLFQVENVAFSSKCADDGSYVNAWTLTSGQVADGGDPWNIAWPDHRFAAYWGRRRTDTTQAPTLRAFWGWYEWRFGWPNCTDHDRVQVDGLASLATST